MIARPASPVLSGYGLVGVPATFEAVPFLPGGDRKRASILIMKRIWKEHRTQAQTWGMWRLPRGGFTPLALSCSYSLIRSSAALIQILYMVGDEQIKRNGYAGY